MEANLLSFDTVKMRLHRVFKKAILVFAPLLAVSVGIAQLSDDFSDGDFTADPTWQGSDANFIVNDDQQLQLNHDEASQSYLATSFTETSLDDKEWQIWVKQSFSGSDNNHGRIYLAFSESDLSYTSGDGANGQGYFILLGEGGSDDAITLYRNDDNVSAPIEVCTGTPGLVSSSFEIRILVRRDNVGNWEIFADEAGGTAFSIEASGTDNTYTTTTNLGVTCNYTVSNADSFFYDDVYFGEWQVDEDPPVVLSANPTGNNSLSLELSELVTSATAEDLSNYFIAGLGNPESILVTESQVDLTFASSFDDGVTMTLTVSGLEDLAGNVMTSQDLDFTWAIVYFPEVGGLIINEIMADPDESLPSPNAEYVELHNTTEQTLDISGVELNGGVFTDVTTIAPNGYLIVTDEDDLIAFLAFPGAVGMDGFPGLTNSGLELILTDDQGNELDAVTYSDTWYQNSVKDDGGWSLELINPLDPCSDASNWIASEDFSGATPGAENSVLDTTADTTPPKAGLALNGGPNSLLVEFDEPLDPLTAAGFTNFLSQDVNDNGVFEVGRSELNPTWLEIMFTDPGTGVYQLFIDDVMDCWGNTANVEICTGFPAEMTFNDVVINEVLFNPVTGGSDFTEILNISDDVMGLEGWRVASVQDEQLNVEVIFTEHNYTLCPGEYMVLTDNPVAQSQQYPGARSNRMLTVDNLPNFLNDNSGVMLFDSLALMDWMYYDEDQHFDLIDDTDGVSLERIDPYWQSDLDNLEENWHSAASAVGYATPGYRNSQYLLSSDIESSVELQSQIFSPDQDGYEDLLHIQYNFDEPGRLVNVTVYNQSGLPVRELARNQLLGTEGSIKWDGLLDDLSLAPVGSYVIYFETFNLDGNVEAVKLVAVVARQF